MTEIDEQESGAGEHRGGRGGRPERVRATRRGPRSRPTGTGRLAAAASSLGLAAVLGLAGCAPAHGSDAAQGSPSAHGSDAGPGPGTRAFYEQTLSWEGCVEDSPAMECAAVKAPVDWADPSGETLDLFLIRHKASGERKGSLLLNPGGPGASGVDFAAEAAEHLSKDLVAAYDLVGWDPRGVGLSHPVTCLSDEEMDTYVSLDSAAAHDQGWDKRFFEACRTNTGPVIDHLGTADTVRDLDMIRALVGDEKLTFYGASYGTYIGALYAETFPDRVGRMVLDSVTDPTVPKEEQDEVAIAGYSEVFEAYLDGCGGRPTCPFRRDPADLRMQRFLQLDETLQERPLRTATPRELTSALLGTAVTASLYAKESWPDLDRGLAAALRGDGTALLGIADGYNGRDDDGHYTPDNAALLVINCLDRADTRSGAQRKADAETLKAKYPELLSEEDGEEVDACSAYGGFRPAPPRAFRITAEQPLVIVALRHDFATPYSGALHVASMIKNHRVVTVEGTGHVAYPGTTSRCLLTAVDTFFLAGTPPATDITCPA